MLSRLGSLYLGQTPEGRVVFPAHLTITIAVCIDGKRSAPRIHEAETRRL